MKNKEIEQILVECNIQHPLIIGYIEKLEKENAELKAQISNIESRCASTTRTLNEIIELGVQALQFENTTSIPFEEFHLFIGNALRNDEK